MPTLANVDLNNYNIEQIQFLMKAALSWKQQKPYLIQTEQEENIYFSLDPILQDKRLFRFSPKKEMLESIKQRLSRFFPDIVANNPPINMLSQEQLDLLTKASEQWAQKRAYEVTHDEVETYYTLPSHLQDYRLFDFPVDVHAQKSAEIKEQIKKESSRIKDYLARVAQTVYKWFGWRGHDMDRSLWPSWESEHESKEAEKEEDV
jgi:hypothetical protein